MCFVMKIIRFILFMYQMKNFMGCMDLLMVVDQNKSHYVNIKDFNRFMCSKTKNKNKIHFCKYCLQCFTRVLIEHKETCLKINGKQTVILRAGSFKFKNHFKELAAPFEIYAGFESLLKGVSVSDRNNNTLYTEKYQKYIPCSFTYKDVSIDDKFRKSVVLYRGKKPINRFIETIIEEYD